MIIEKETIRDSSYTCSVNLEFWRSKYLRRKRLLEIVAIHFQLNLEKSGEVNI